MKAPAAWWLLLATACAPAVATAPRSETRVVLPARSALPPAEPAPAPPRDASPVLLIRTLPLLPDACSGVLAASEQGKAPYDDVRRCLDEHPVYLPLACWGAKGWSRGPACLQQLAPTWRSHPRPPVRCNLDAADPSWVRDVALVLPVETPAVVATGSDDGASVTLVPAPVDGEGLPTTEATHRALVEAIERDVGLRMEVFLVTQSVEASLVGAAEPERLLNVRLVGLPSAAFGMTFRSSLYLFSGAAPPVLLHSTTGDRPSETLRIVATTDLDRDGRQELVVHTSDFTAPVETALMTVTPTGLERVAAWACTDRGLVSLP